MLRLRKTLMTIMIDKVGKLSTQSMVKTNPGKLIAIIASDIY
jgi:hypothetical protein